MFLTFFLILSVLRNTGQVFCRMFLTLDLCDVFLMIRLGLHVFGEETNTDKVHFYLHHVRVHAVTMACLCSC